MGRAAPARGLRRCLGPRDRRARDAAAGRPARQPPQGDAGAGAAGAARGGHRHRADALCARRAAAEAPAVGRGGQGLPGRAGRDSGRGLAAGRRAGRRQARHAGRRLLRRRRRRAGVHNVERRSIAENAKWLKRQKGNFDRVLVDAPCTGTGTWRRNPDGRWTLAPEDLAELVPKQADILDQAARLVKPGGRLIYATCSVLSAENERQIEAFVERHPDFTVTPIAETGLPPTLASGPYLRLSPLKHGTDGFFGAVLTRSSPPPSAEEESTSCLPPSAGEGGA